MLALTRPRLITLGFVAFFVFLFTALFSFHDMLGMRPQQQFHMIIDEPLSDIDKRTMGIVNSGKRTIAELRICLMGQQFIVKNLAGNHTIHRETLSFELYGAFTLKVDGHFGDGTRIEHEVSFMDRNGRPLQMSINDKGELSFR